MFEDSDGHNPTVYASSAEMRYWESNEWLHDQEEKPEQEEE